MELMVLERFGSVPDDPLELREKFLEADWMEKRSAKRIAGELAVILGKMFGGK